MSETTQQPEPGAGTVRKVGRPAKAMGTNGGDKPKRIRRTKAQIEAANAAANAAANSAPASNVPLITKAPPMSPLSQAASKFLGMDATMLSQVTWPSLAADQEVTAMIQIVAGMDSCPIAVRSRIATWLFSRYADLLPSTKGA